MRDFELTPFCCNQIAKYGDDSQGIDKCTDCEFKWNLQVLRTRKGWYLGVVDDSGICCRATPVYPTRKYAAAILSASMIKDIAFPS